MTRNYHKGVHCGGETYVRLGEPTDSFEEGRYRQLLPLEIERLFGFPDNWTNIEWNNRPAAPKTRRYAALGNTMSVPVIKFILDRMNQVDTYMEAL